MIDQTCKNCHFWRRPKGLNIQSTMGECHRYAMTAHLIPAKDGLGNVQVQTVGTWPPAPADEWCGEWAAAPAYAHHEMMMQGAGLSLEAARDAAAEWNARNARPMPLSPSAETAEQYPEPHPQSNEGSH